MRFTTYQQIANNQFAFVEIDPWLQQCENLLIGRFDTRTHAWQLPNALLRGGSWPTSGESAATWMTCGLSR